MHASGKTSGSFVNSTGPLPEKASLMNSLIPGQYADLARLSALPLKVYSYLLPKSVTFIPNLSLYPSNFALSRFLAAQFVRPGTIITHTSYQIRVGILKIVLVNRYVEICRNFCQFDVKRRKFGYS